MRTLTLLIFICFNSTAQKKDNYIEYYNLCNKANKALYQQDYKQALNKYDSAFRQVHYQHISNLLNAVTVAIHLQNEKRATHFLRQAILNGLKPSMLSDKEYLTLNDFNEFKQLKDSSEILRNKFKYRINTEYSTEIDSLYYVDQVIIRNIKTLTPLYKIDLYVYTTERTKYDSLSFVYLLKLIQKYGFPSEEKIGPESYEGVKLVIHHSARMQYFKEQLEMLRMAVIKGEYRPEDYAWMYDQSRTKVNEAPYFYYQVGNPSKLMEKEKAEVNKRRSEFGLNSLDDDKIPRLH
jgi:hypothetical protein